MTKWREIKLEPAMGLDLNDQNKTRGNMQKGTLWVSEISADTSKNRHPKKIAGCTSPKAEVKVKNTSAISATSDDKVKKIFIKNLKNC